MIVVVLVADPVGEPLSVAVKVTLKVNPDWLCEGVKENVPVAGFPVTVGKLMPETRPVPVRVTVLAGRSTSLALTAKVVVDPKGALTIVGAETVGDTLTSLTVMVTLAVFIAPKLSWAVNVIEYVPGP